MAPEEIKAGETYNVRVRVARIEPNRIVCRPLNKDGTPSDFCPNYFNFAEAEAFYPAENVTKSAKNAQKYDPCRKFREGDIVEFDTHGRDISESMKRAGVTLGERYTVTEDENNTGYVSFIGADGIEHHSIFFWLKLVQPVEELETYYLDTITTDDNNTKPYFMIKTRKHEHRIRTFYANDFETIEQTEIAAKAECTRLNAEYRAQNAEHRKGEE